MGEFVYYHSTYQKILGIYRAITRVLISSYILIIKPYQFVVPLVTLPYIYIRPGSYPNHMSPSYIYMYLKPIYMGDRFLFTYIQGPLHTLTGTHKRERKGAYVHTYI